jgi:hypothetical protein
MERAIMGQLKHVFTASKNSKSLVTYLDSSEGGYCFEVKDGEELLYRGGSFEDARKTYENLIPEASF